jgi:hypothetical protein
MRNGGSTIAHLDNDLEPILRQNPRRELGASVRFSLVPLDIEVLREGNRLSG